MSWLSIGDINHLRRGRGARLVDEPNPSRYVWGRLVICAYGFVVCAIERHRNPVQRGGDARPPVSRCRQAIRRSPLSRDTRPVSFRPAPFTVLATRVHCQAAVNQSRLRTLSQRSKSAFIPVTRPPSAIKRLHYEPHLTVRPPASVWRFALGQSSRCSADQCPPLTAPAVTGPRTSRRAPTSASCAGTSGRR
jgi:hypothetical protein